MKTQLKINGEMKDVEIENGEITIIEPKKKKTGWEKAKPLKYYYYGGPITGGLATLIENGKDLDKKAYETANYFSNRELSKNITKAQALQRTFWRWQAENDVPPTIEQWGIEYYSSSPQCLKPIPNGSYHIWGLPYFSSAKKAKEFIKTYKDDLIWLFKEFKWRMDG